MNRHRRQTAAVMILNLLAVAFFWEAIRCADCWPHRYMQFGILAMLPISGWGLYLTFRNVRYSQDRYNS